MMIKDEEYNKNSDIQEKFLNTKHTTKTMDNKYKSTIFNNVKEQVFTHTINDLFQLEGKMFYLNYQKQ